MWRNSNAYKISKKKTFLTSGFSTLVECMNGMDNYINSEI